MICKVQKLPFSLEGSKVLQFPQDPADRFGEREVAVKEHRQRKPDQELENQAADREDKRVGDRFEEDLVMKQLHVIVKADEMLLAAQEIHDFDVLEAENDIMHDRVTDENQHVDNRWQRKEQAEVIMPEERFHPVHNDPPLS